MNTGHKLEITIPAEMPQAYVDLVKIKIEDILSQRCDCSKHWIHVLEDLEKQGWNSSLHMYWVAEARRDSNLERAEGASLCETVESLRQLTLLDDVENCP